MSEFLSLKEYDRLATMMLFRNNLPISDTNIHFVNEFMMKADMRYKDDITGRDKDQFRLFYAKFAIKALFTKLKKENETGKMFKSLDAEVKFHNGLKPLRWEPECKHSTPSGNCYTKELREIIESSDQLTTKEKYVIIQHCFNNVPMQDIGKTLNASTYYLKNKAKEKLQWLESKCLE